MALLPLLPALQSYEWGSRRAIADLFNWPPSAEPVAELWFGDHPAAPSQLTCDADGRSLIDVVAADPVAVLGAATVEQFGPGLPFLLKILSAETPLSLQVHPSREQARAGFAAEAARHVPESARHRNYRDDNHKPELLCALTEFWALSGFRPVEATAELLRAIGIDQLHPFCGWPDSRSDVGATVEALLGLTGTALDHLLTTVVAGAKRVAHTGSAWAEEAGWILTVADVFPGDVGIAVALLLNLVHLWPGQYIFTPAGRMHAYLRGTGIEIMASSDNVLRCGLTSKHVDTAELLRIVDFTAAEQVAHDPVPLASGEVVFNAAGPDFALSRVVLTGDRELRVAGTPQIVLCVGGQLTVRSAGHETTLYAGTAVFAPFGPEVVISGTGDAFRATVNLTG